MGRLILQEIKEFAIHGVSAKRFQGCFRSPGVILHPFTEKESPVKAEVSQSNFDALRKCAPHQQSVLFIAPKTRKWLRREPPTNLFVTSKMW
jgi:hypothetical protein